MGLQFENLVISNCSSLFPLLGLQPTDVLVANPFFQRKTNRQKGCQIDLMIQTRHQTLFLVEIKFSRTKVGARVVESMREKMERIAIPKGFSMRAVLVHVNGVTEDVKYSGVFDFIVDFSQLLK